MKIKIALTLALLLLLAAFSGLLRDRLALNLDGLDTVHILYTGAPFLSARPAWLNESQACSASWMAALRAEAQGRLAERDQAFLQAVACDPQFVVFLQYMYPEDLDLAQMALTNQPGSAASWFWVGDLLPEKKVEYYQQGLQIDPRDGLRWLSLGHALQSQDLELALQAFLQACKNGDPGYHGCANAGATAEKLGLFEEALEFYRMSSYSRIREMADALEQRIRPSP